MADFEERTEQATPRKRQKAREKGQVARSGELSSMAAIGGIVLVMYFGGKHFIHHITAVTGKFLSLQYGNDPFAVLRTASVETIVLLIPFLGAAFTLAVGTNICQGGFVIKPLELEFERINPINGIKKIFSFNGLSEFLKSLLKFLIGGCLFYYVVKESLRILPSLTSMDLHSLSKTSGHLIIKAIAYGFICFFVLSVIGYFLERWRFERSIRMTKEEIKEEFKESEGHPLIKSRIKSIQRELARKRMMQEVPKATVVITNPTHIAIALEYEDKKMSAPKVIAKGAGFIAEKIMEIARKHGVPIVEDKPLARVLYKLELNSYIPAELYRAVAKILAYIYKLRGAA